MGYPGPESTDKDAVSHGWWWQEYEKAKKERSGLLADETKWQEYIAQFVKEAPRDSA